ncbi:MAG TPA: molybdopterin cofactor-binding domain-containing protein [Gemmatimonadaceae bacterium]|nr:molybdopterin cofactor-binding domain-containing protein [Gemmatimonadaceae bacterium]
MRDTSTSNDLSREIELRDGSGRSTRREFLKVLGSGLVVVLVTRDAFGAPVARQQSGGSPTLLGESTEGNIAEQIAAWLEIGADGTVTVYTGKVEFGQGIRTSLAQEVAEELRVPLERVKLVMGDTELTPFDMGTFGSRSTPQMGTKLRQASAAAREHLVALAAERWKVDAETLTAADGRVTDPRSKRSLGYGELTAGKKLTDVVRDDVPLTPAERWKIAGASAPKVGARDIVTGRHEYTSDMRLPGMLYARVLRPPSIGATLASLDESAVRAIPGAVVTRDGDFVGVAAPKLMDAARAVAALRVKWKPAPGPLPTSSNIYEYLKRTKPKDEGDGWRRTEPIVQGDAAAALASAPHKLTRTYEVAYIAHVPLEPRAALAQWSREGDRDKLTVWTGTQRPFAVREDLAEQLGVRQEDVRVIVPDTGSGYGGKHTGEAALEAARIARAAGRPVKLVWTREEEFRWAYFRPAGVIDVSAGLNEDGTITAWTFDNYNSGPAGIRPLYAIANQRVEYHPSDSPLRQGSYRALAATANHFAREMHFDELASLVGMDPLEFRLRNLRDGRLRAVFQAATERFGWERAARDPRRAIGVAGGFEKGGYVATCAEVAVRGDDVRVLRAVTAFDCGAVVNPDGLRNQITGALIQGIGGALFEAIDFDNGVIRNARLSEYRVPRFSDTPSIDVVLVDRKDQPSFGAGEAPIMAIAPAIGAAIARATGVRVRSLPMGPELRKQEAESREQ